MKIDAYHRQQNDSPWSVDFSNVQIVHKFEGSVRLSEWPLTWTSRSRYSPTSNVSQMVQDGDMFTVADWYEVVYDLPDCLLSTTLNDPRIYSDPQGGGYNSLVLCNTPYHVYSKGGVIRGVNLERTIKPVIDKKLQWINIGLKYQCLW